MHFIGSKVCSFYLVFVKPEQYTPNHESYGSRGVLQVHNYPKNSTVKSII